MFIKNVVPETQQAFLLKTLCRRTTSLLIKNVVRQHNALAPAALEQQDFLFLF